MTREADLQEAIRAGLSRAGADLDDPGPYLVYADWLLQRDDPRGELIAIQHAREHTETPELAERERALFDTHLAAWLGAAWPAYHAGELELAWRRGLVWSARIRKLDPESPDDPVAVLRAFAPLPVAQLVSRLTIELASFGTAWPDVARDVIAALPRSLAHIGLGSPPTAPAALDLVALPRSGRVVGYGVGARIDLRANRRFVIGCIPGCDLECWAPGLGGRRNSSIDRRDGRWTLEHYGHALPIAVNGHEIQTFAVLCHGDRIEPAPGLVLQLVLDDTAPA